LRTVCGSLTGYLHDHRRSAIERNLPIIDGDTVNLTVDFDNVIARSDATRLDAFRHGQLLNDLITLNDPNRHVVGLAFDRQRAFVQFEDDQNASEDQRTSEAGGGQPFDDGRLVDLFATRWRILRRALGEFRYGEWECRSGGMLHMRKTTVQQLGDFFG